MGKKERKKNHILLQKVAWNLAWNCSSNLAAIHTAVAHIIFSQLVFFISIFKTSLVISPGCIAIAILLQGISRTFLTIDVMNDKGAVFPDWA